MSVQIIPAIDLLDGSCVRLLHGDFEKCKVYELDAARLQRAALFFWMRSGIFHPDSRPNCYVFLNRRNFSGLAIQRP